MPIRSPKRPGPIAVLLLAGGFLLVAQRSRAPAAPSRACPEPRAELPGKPAARPAFVLGARGRPRRPCATTAWGVQGRRSIVNFGDADPQELLEKAEEEAKAMGMKPIMPGRRNTPSESTRKTAREWVLTIRKSSPGLFGRPEFNKHKETIQVSMTRWGCKISVSFMQANAGQDHNYIMETRDVIKFCRIIGLFYEKA
mmetsp:Transcript_5229/g.15422  ORF Transcript_5229/g.15422 Transcript_5229/m.15422 type:complete len:198 (-) Transcript_5229:97-690(-)